MVIQEALRRNDLFSHNFGLKRYKPEDLDSALNEPKVSKRLDILTESRTTLLAKELKEQISQDQTPWIDFDMLEGSITLGWGDPNKHLDKVGKFVEEKLKGLYWYRGIWISANSSREEVVVAAEEVITIERHGWEKSSSTVIADILAWAYRYPGWLKVRQPRE